MYVVPDFKTKKMTLPTWEDHDGRTRYPNRLDAIEYIQERSQALEIAMDPWRLATIFKVAGLILDPDDPWRKDYARIEKDEVRRASRKHPRPPVSSWIRK
jgi:hypothetical protein